MKRILITSLILLLTANVAFAAPNYDPNFKTKTYCTEYNDKLLKKLKDDYHKKYTVKVNDNYYIDTSPLNAYRDEVITPYDLQRKNTPTYIK